MAGDKILHGGADFGFADEDGAVDDLSADIKGDGAGLDTPGCGVGESLLAGYVDDLSGLQAGMHRGRRLGRAGYDLGGGAHRFQVGSHSRDETPAPDGDEHSVESVDLLEEFDGDRALSADNMRVIVGRDVGEAVLVRE